MAATKLRPQPVGNQPQEAVPHGVTEGIVDVLEQVKIDAQHRDPLVGGLCLDLRFCQCLAKPLLIELAVRQIRQAIMMGHVGDTRLGFATLGDIDNSDEIAVAPRRTTPAARMSGHGSHCPSALRCRQLRLDWLASPILTSASSWLVRSSSGQMSWSVMARNLSRLYP